MVDCADSGISCVGGRAGVELDFHQSTGDWPAGGDLVVCWAVFGFIGHLYPSFLWYENVFASACHGCGQIEIFVEAGDAARNMGGGAAQFELPAPTWCA